MEEVTEVDKIVKLALIRIGIKCDQTGFIYMFEAVKEAIKQPELIHNLRKLFTIVAQRCGAKDYKRVEANIHNSISYTYKTKGFDFVNRIYGMEVLKPNRKPTTAEMIRLIAEYYSLGLYKNEYEFQG